MSIGLSTANTSKRASAQRITKSAAWAEVERPDVALIIVSNFLSNPAKEYLDSYRRNNHPSFKIRSWEKPQLTRMLSRRVSLQRKYNLTDTPIRNVKAILTADEEFFTKVWDGRKAPAEYYRAQGTPDYIIKGMLRAKRDAKKRFGKKNLGHGAISSGVCSAASYLPSVGYWG